MERLEELSFTGCPILLFSLKTTFILQDVCYQYWPSDDTRGVLNYGEFTVSILQATKQNGFIQRHISITNPKVMVWVSKINLHKLNFVFAIDKHDNCKN